MSKILVLNGANIPDHWQSNPQRYGSATGAELNAMLNAHAKEQDYDLEIFYTHVEGHAIERLWAAAKERFDGLVMNPGAFLYNAYALRDCLNALPFPFFEVHMGNGIHNRGLHSITAEVSKGAVSGFGLYGYCLAVEGVLHLLKTGKKPA